MTDRRCRDDEWYTSKARANHGLNRGGILGLKRSGKQRELVLHTFPVRIICAGLTASDDILATTPAPAS